MQIKYKNKTYTVPKPFDNCYMGAEPNKRDDESIIDSAMKHLANRAKLPAFAVAIYDTIIGAERSEDYDYNAKRFDVVPKELR